VTLDHIGRCDPDDLAAMRRQHEDDLAERYLEACHREASESEAAMEAHWSGVFAQQQSGDVWSAQVWDGGPDRRMFAVDGEVPERARLDVEPRRVWLEDSA
jgi:hypothetical protein